MLKKNDYLDRRTGLTLSVVALAHVNTDDKKATFLIGVSREAIEQGRVIERVTIVDIPFTRDGNPYEQAYNYAKGQYVAYNWNTETKQKEEVLLPRPFYGWEDEITSE